MNREESSERKERSSREGMMDEIKEKVSGAKSKVMGAKDKMMGAAKEKMSREEAGRKGAEARWGKR